MGGNHSLTALCATHQHHLLTDQEVFEDTLREGSQKLTGHTL